MFSNISEDQLAKFKETAKKLMNNLKEWRKNNNGNEQKMEIY